MIIPAKQKFMGGSFLVVTTSYGDMLNLGISKFSNDKVVIGVLKSLDENP